MRGVDFVLFACAHPGCAHYNGSKRNQHSICKYPCTDKDGDTNMDHRVDSHSHTIQDPNPDHDPDITTDEHGRAYIHVNGIAYRYPYADTRIIGDTGEGPVAKHRRKRARNSEHDAESERNGFRKGRRRARN